MPGGSETAQQLSLFPTTGPNVIELRTRADLILLSAQATNTKRAYASDWRQFARWCRESGRQAMPASPETLRLFIVDQISQRSISTVERRVAAIADRHRATGETSPLTDEVRQLLRGARRELGKPAAQKAAITPQELRRICRHEHTSPRDRALLTLGFAGGMRRSEIAELRIDDLCFRTQGMEITIRKSKTDQERKGRHVGIFRGKYAATCPVRNMQTWLSTRGLHPGPLFPGGPGSTTGLSGRWIAELVKRAVVSIGLDPHHYGAHSLRAGCVTAAILAGTPAPLIMQRTGHKSMTTLERYVRTATLFERDPLAGAL